jgi:hypothetical protein
MSAYPAITPGGRVRVVEMAGHLRDHGVNIEFRPTMTDEEYRRLSLPGGAARKAIAVLRSAYRARLRTNGALTLVYRLRSLMPGAAENVPLDVYDFDDAIYLDAQPSVHGLLGRIKRERQRSIGYMRQARLVVAGNDVLADEARRHANWVEVVPSCVDPSLQEVRRHREVDVLTLGWTGSQTTSAYLGPLIGVTARLRARGHPVRLIVMGARLPGAEAFVEHRPWTLAGERELLREIDVGVMPLPDTPWTRGKCGYKLLRYFSAGLPVVATPVGVNTRLLAGAAGCAATSEHDWLRAIEQLAGDVTERQQRGTAARAFVEREYSYQTWAPRLAQLITELA